MYRRSLTQGHPTDGIRFPWQARYSVGLTVRRSPFKAWVSSRHRYHIVGVWILTQELTSIYPNTKTNHDISGISAAWVFTYEKSALVSVARIRLLNTCICLCPGVHRRLRAVILCLCHKSALTAHKDVHAYGKLREIRKNMDSLCWNTRSEYMLEIYLLLQFRRFSLVGKRSYRDIGVKISVTLQEHILVSWGLGFHTWNFLWCDAS